MSFQWFKDSPINKKILSVLAVPIAFTAVVGVIAILAIQFISHNSSWVDHTHRALAKGAAIVSAAVDMETGMRGFLVAGRENFLEPYVWGEERLFAGLADLRSTVSDNPGQVQRLREAEQIISDWKTEVADVQIALRRAVGDTATMNDVVDIVIEARGKTYFDAFRTLMAEFEAEEAALLEVRSASLESAKLLATVSIALFLAIAIGSGILIARRAGASIANPIQSIIAAMQDIIDGQQDVAIDGQTRKDEVGEMARATQVFQENAAKVLELAKADTENAQKLEEAAKMAAEQAAIAAEKEKEDRVQAAEKQKKVDELQSAIKTVVDKAVNGDFSGRVDLDLDDNELAALATNVNTLVQGVAESVEAVRKTMERVAGGDLTKSMEGNFKGEFKGLQNNTNEMISVLKTLVGEIGGSASNLASSSGELRDTSDALSKQAEQNAASLEETSAAVEELTASIKQVSENVTDANKNARSASETAQSSSAVAADAADAMTRIADASKEIAKVITVINDIAFQINLLALNAGVEAARAGEAGLGFSVVASEVRQLAQRAAEAAKEIDDVIARSDTAVTEGVAKVTDAQQSLEKISESVISVSKGIDHISTAIAEQVNGITEINGAVSRIDDNTQKQAASFEEVTAAGSLLSSEAESLKQSTTRFKTGNEAAVSRTTTKKTPTVTSSKKTAPIPLVEGNLAQDLSGWDEF